MPMWSVLLLVVDFCAFVRALDNGLANRPPMGWMPWERFRCVMDCYNYPSDCISEQLFRRITDRLVDQGYAAVGYEYVIMDDCWMQSKRNTETKKLQPDQRRFPNGLESLSNYIHERGLKFGIYHNLGHATCTGYGPGAQDSFDLDAQTFADWKIDYVKMDGCFMENGNMSHDYPAFGKALNNTGRPMVYSCSWPYYQQDPDYALIETHCNLWRFAKDIRDGYDSVRHIMNEYTKQQKLLQQHGGPGHWNDPDMLMLGNYHMSYDASRLQMAIWAVLAAPLIMSNDLETVRPEIKEILQNRDIIAVDQDELGIPGYCVYSKGTIQVWLRPIGPMNNRDMFSFAVAFIHLDQRSLCPLCPTPFRISLQSLTLDNPSGYQVVDLFNASNCLGLYKPHDEFQTRINPAGVQFYKFRAAPHY